MTLGCLNESSRTQLQSQREKNPDESRSFLWKCFPSYMRTICWPFDLDEDARFPFAIQSPTPTWLKSRETSRILSLLSFKTFSKPSLLHLLKCLNYKMGKKTLTSTNIMITEKLKANPRCLNWIVRFQSNSLQNNLLKCICSQTFVQASNCNPSSRESRRSSRIESKPVIPESTTHSFLSLTIFTAPWCIWLLRLNLNLCCHRLHF